MYKATKNFQSEIIVEQQSGVKGSMCGAPAVKGHRLVLLCCYCYVIIFLVVVVIIFFVQTDVASTTASRCMWNQLHIPFQLNMHIYMYICARVCICVCVHICVCFFFGLYADKVQIVDKQIIETQQQPKKLQVYTYSSTI